MTQNIYDDPAFFEAYSRLERSVNGLSGAAEWPALRALLPDPRGLEIVDLGCGFGWFARWARQHGARSVRGHDISQAMLTRARSMTSDDGIIYERSDLEHLDLPADSCDLVFSSLAVHYVENLERLLGTIHRALRPGGAWIFSTEHPIYTAPSHPGWSAGENGDVTWPVDNYLNEGPRITDWLAPGVVKQHRTIGTHIALLARAGFSVTHLEEWGPTAEQIAAHPEWSVERHRPMFLLIAAHR